MKLIFALRRFQTSPFRRTMLGVVVQFCILRKKIRIVIYHRMHGITFLKLRETKILCIPMYNIRVGSVHTLQVHMHYHDIGSKYARTYYERRWNPRKQAHEMHVCLRACPRAQTIGKCLNMLRKLSVIWTCMHALTQTDIYRKVYFHPTCLTGFQIVSFSLIMSTISTACLAEINNRQNPTYFKQDIVVAQ